MFSSTRCRLRKASVVWQRISSCLRAQHYAVSTLWQDTKAVYFSLKTRRSAPSTFLSAPSTLTAVKMSGRVLALIRPLCLIKLAVRHLWIPGDRCTGVLTAGVTLISLLQTGQQRWWEQEIPVDGNIQKGELITHNLTELIRPEAYVVRLTPITRFGEGDSAIRVVTYSGECDFFMCVWSG